MRSETHNIGTTPQRIPMFFFLPKKRRGKAALLTIFNGPYKRRISF